MSKSIVVGVLGVACVVTAATAADLDAFRPAPPRVIEGFGPPPPRRFVRPLPSPCHLIAAPRLNLVQDDVVGAEPQIVCLSRGLYTDSFNR